MKSKGSLARTLFQINDTMVISVSMQLLEAFLTLQHAGCTSQPGMPNLNTFVWTCLGICDSLSRITTLLENEVHQHENTMRVRSPSPQSVQHGSCQILCQAAAKNPEASYKKWLLNMPTCCQYFRCCLPPITKASDHASYRSAMPRHPAPESMSCYIFVELLVQTRPKFSVTTTSNQTEVVRRKHKSSWLCLDMNHTHRFPPYWKS